MKRKRGGRDEEKGRETEERETETERGTKRLQTSTWF